VAELAVHASVPQLRRALSRYSFDPPAPNGHTQQSTTFPTPTPTPASDSDSGSGTINSTTGEDGTSDHTAGDNGTSDKAGCDSGTSDSAAGIGETGSSEVGHVGCLTGAAETWNGLGLVEDRASAPAELSMSHDQWGRFTLRFNAPADIGALVQAALTEAKDALFGALETGAEPREVTWADAMVQIAGRSLGAVTSINRRDAFRTYIHLDSEGAWLTGQPRLPAHLAAKLTCDGILQPVWHTQGAPVNVGRAQRIVPARTRRLVEDRDRGCRFPGCPTTTHVECHHLIHWADGGPTDTLNLACLCPYHHDAHHNRDFNVTGDADNPNGLTFTTRHGFPIHPGPTFTTPANPPSPPSPDPPQPPDPHRSPETAPSPTSAPPPDPPQTPDPHRSPQTAPSPTSAQPPDPPRSPTSPDEPSPADSPSQPTASPAPANTVYRGPSGETLNLRWVTFHEPREPALI